MNQTINFNHVSDIYDNYVTVDFDIPFFLNETKNVHGQILELMCGTGRVSIPLLKNGKEMVCVDYSSGMLEKFESKIRNDNYKVELVNSDVTKLKLDKKFEIAFIPFHSLSEILTFENQKKALQTISEHLSENGTFILTLQNPKTRLKQLSSEKRKLGDFPLAENKTLKVYFESDYDKDKIIVVGKQFYEITDVENNILESREMDIRFRPTSHSELLELIEDLPLEITQVYGDYSYGDFLEEESNFMIYKMKRI